MVVDHVGRSWCFDGIVVVLQLFFYGLWVMLAGSGEVLLGRIES